jgi:hypothetical protein
VFARHAPDSVLWHRYGLFEPDQKESLGGTLTYGPAVASWSPDRLDVFYRGTNGALYQKYFDGQWRGHFKLTADNTIHSHPTAVSWGPNRIDVFARSASGGIVQISWDGTAWRQNEGLGLGVPMYHGLGVSSRGPGKLDLFYRGNDNALWHKAYDAAAGGWGGWVTVGGSMSSDPRAASPSENRTDVFARGTNGALVQWTWQNGAWKTIAQDLGGSLGSGPAVVAHKPAMKVYSVSEIPPQLSVYARRAGDGALMEITYNGWVAGGWDFEWRQVPYTPPSGGNCCAG